MKLVLVWVFNVPLPFLFLSFGLCGGFVSICPEGKEGGGRIRQVSPQHTALLSVPNQLSLIAEEEEEAKRRGGGAHSIQSPAKKEMKSERKETLFLYRKKFLTG